MEPTEDKHFSFPNSGQKIPGVTDSNMPEENVAVKRPTVNIIDAINAQKPIDADLQRVHTYQGDLTSAIKDDSLSMIKVALAEKKRQERQGTQIDLEESSSKKPILIGIVIIGVLVILSLIYFFVTKIGSSGNTPTETDQPAATSLLYTEKNSSINVNQKDSDDITRLIKRENSDDQDLGSMKAISFIFGTGTSTRNITTEELLKGLDTRAPDSLIRSLDSRFLLGVYYFSPNDFFLLVKVNSYDTAFAGMLQWEPDMENDIGSILITRKSVQPITKNLLATTTSSTTESVDSPIAYSRRVWVDRVIDNKDARVLVDTEGNPAMLYTFLDKNTLVISSSDKTLKEISFRLTAGRIVR